MPRGSHVINMEPSDAKNGCKGQRRDSEGTVYNLKDWLILRLRHVEASANTALMLRLTILVCLSFANDLLGSRGPANMCHIPKRYTDATHICLARGAHAGFSGSPPCAEGCYAVRATRGPRVMVQDEPT